MSLADLRARGLTLTTGEALAVAQLVFEGGTDEACPPFGPLSPENIVLHSNGAVTSTACAATPTVLEAAILLEELLGDGGGHVPGALRYTLGRGLHEVAAPPFESLVDFSGALRRFEQGDRAAMVRAVYVRATTPPTVGESVWESVALPFAAAVLAGIALIGAGETMHAGRTPRPSRALNPALVAHPIVFNPPPVIAPARAAVFVRAAAPAPKQVHRRESARRDKPSTGRAGFWSRMFSRIRIKVDEL